MKRNWLLMAVCMATVLFLTGITSCSSDDDDDDEGTGSTQAGVLDHDANTRVKSVGDYTFYYMDNGQVDYITRGNTRYDFTYSPNKITETYNGEQEAVYTVNYNGSGYITKVDVQKSFMEDGVVEVTGSTTLAYDDSGHLVSMEGSSRQTYQGATSTSTGAVSLTWQSNRLVAAVWNTSEQGVHGSNYTSNKTYTYVYADNINDFHNIHHQYAPSLSGAYGSAPEDVVAFVGLLGKGSLYLPESCISEIIETEDTRASDSGHYSYTESFSYGFNGDGSIDFCRVGGTNYHYSYESLTGETRAGMTWVDNADRSDKRPGLFSILFPYGRR